MILNTDLFSHIFLYLDDKVQITKVCRLFMTVVLNNFDNNILNYNKLFFEKLRPIKLNLNNKFKNYFNLNLNLIKILKLDLPTDIEFWDMILTLNKYDFDYLSVKKRDENNSILEYNKDDVLLDNKSIFIDDKSISITRFDVNLYAPCLDMDFNKNFEHSILFFIFKDLVNAFFVNIDSRDRAQEFIYNRSFNTIYCREIFCCDDGEEVYNHQNKINLYGNVLYN